MADAPSKPTFTIVMPSYNYGHFLPGALESVAAQNRNDIQVVLVDDASEDDTPQVAERYAGRIEYVRNENNLGAGGAWREGLERARGKFLVKLDADDELLPGHLDAVEKAFESDAEVGMVLASVLLRSEADGTLVPEYVTSADRTLGAIEFRRHLLKGLPFRMPGCAVRRAVTLGKRGPDPGLYQIHDWEYFVRVCKGHKGRLLRAPSAIYRIHGRSISSTARQGNRLYNDITRWLAMAKQPGEGYIEAGDRKILVGSCACLLLAGFGSRLNPVAYLRFVPVYLRALSIAVRGGAAQVLRMHRALFCRAVGKTEAGP
jgi:glycosyltransferase involved in cell wall biosynthesis